MTDRDINKEDHKRPEDAKFPLGMSFVFGLQHVLTMCAGVIAVPLIMGQAAHLSGEDTALLISAAFFMGGIFTLVQTLGVPFVGGQLPLIQGVSFDPIATMIAIVSISGSMQSLFGAVIVASVFGVLIAPIYSKFLRFFPPVVTGSLITVIGLSLLPVATHWAMGEQSSADYGSIGNIGLAAVTLAVGLGLSKLGSGVISRLSILLAIVIGTVIALAFGKADFSGLSSGAAFAFPGFLHFGPPTFQPAAIISMMVSILVILTESTAGILAIREIVGTKIDHKRFNAALRVDMASGIVAPFFGSFPQSAFVQNIGLVAMTGVKSRFVVAAGGVILLVVGLFPVLGRVVSAVPLPVLGAAGLLLFGSVAVSGIRMLGSVDYQINMNMIIVAVTIGVGLIPTVEPNFYDQFPNWFQMIAKSGISSAAIVAVTLNLVFNHLQFGTPRGTSVLAAGADRRANSK